MCWQRLAAGNEQLASTAKLRRTLGEADTWRVMPGEGTWPWGWCWVCGLHTHAWTCNLCLGRKLDKGGWGPGSKPSHQESRHSKHQGQRWRRAPGDQVALLAFLPMASACLGAQSGVTRLADGLAICSLGSCCQESCPWIDVREKTGEWHTYCVTPFMNKLVKSNSTSTSLAFFNEPVSNKWSFNSTKQPLYRKTDWG